MEKQRDFKAMFQNFVRDNESVKEIQFLLKDDVEIEEICGKGVANYVFNVSSKDKSELAIIKYGETELRKPIEALQSISLDRQTYEAESLKLLAEIYPGSVPVLYCFDKQHQIIAMETLLDMELLGVQLEGGNADVGVGMRIGKLLATIHNKTSRKYIGSEKWQEFESKFLNLGNKEVFVKSFIGKFEENSPGVVVPKGGSELYQKMIQINKAEGLKDKVVSLFYRRDCYVHGDLHFNHYAIFPKSERIAIFDLEMANISHPSFDLGITIVSYPLFYQRQQSKAKNEAVREKYMQAMKGLVDTYLEETDIFQGHEKADFISDLALVAADVQLLIALFPDMDAILELNAEQRVNLMVSVLHTLENYKEIKTSDQLVDALFWTPSD